MSRVIVLNVPRRPGATFRSVNSRASTLCDLSGYCISHCFWTCVQIFSTECRAHLIAKFYVENSRRIRWTGLVRMPFARAFVFCLSLYSRLHGSSGLAKLGGQKSPVIVATFLWNTSAGSCGTEVSSCELFTNNFRVTQFHRAFRTFSNFGLKVVSPVASTHAIREFSAENSGNRGLFSAGCPFQHDL